MLQKAQNPGEGLESSVIRWSYFIVSLCLCLLYFHKNETNCTLVQLTGFNINQTYGMVQCRIWTHKVDKTKVPEIPPRFMCGSKHHVFLHFFAKHDLSAPKHTHPSHQQLSSFKNWKKQSTSLKLEKTSQLSLGILHSSVQVFEWSTASWRHFPRIILEGENLRDISSASHLEETFLGIAPNLDSLQLGSRNKIIQ